MNRLSFAFLVASAAALAACGGGGGDGDDEPNTTPTTQNSITVSPQDITVAADEGTENINITATGAWTASVANGATWLSVSPTSGVAGSGSITVKVNANDSYDERNAAITLKCGTANKSVTVTQIQKNALVVAKNEYDMPAAGGQLDFQVQTNVDLEVSVSASWITQVSTRALVTKNLYFDIAANTSETSSREGTITIKGNGTNLTQIIKVVQAKRDKIVEINSDDKTSATLNLDNATDAGDVQTAINEANTAGVTKYIISGDFSKLGIVYSGNDISNPFQKSSVEEIDMSGVTNFTELPAYAFYTINTLRKLILPETVNMIGKGAFYECASLETIMADGAATIGEKAFSYCSSLAEISLPSATSIGYGIFAKSYALNKVSMSKLSVITSDPAFESSVTTVEMPELTTIEKGDFLSNTSIIAVSFPKLESASNNAFAGCVSLVSASLPSLTTVSERTFYDCRSLTSVSLPAATTIGKEAFLSCKSIGTISLPAATKIDTYAFSGCASLTAIYLPVATTIGSSAFNSCTSLTALDLPSATSLGSSINDDCTAMTTIKLTARGTISTVMNEMVSIDYTFSKPYLIDLTLNSDKESEVQKVSGTSNGYPFTAKWHYARFKSINFE